MALDIEDEYVNSAPADASYPQGSFINESAPGLNDGTPLEKAWVNDVAGLLQALLKSGGIVRSGNADTAANKNSSQYLQGILHQVLGANTFDESGAADAYILDVVDDNPAPANYSSNMNVVFIPGNTNTGASTINVEGLGAKSIRLGGVLLVGGEIVAGVRTTLVYDSANGWFELITQTGKVVQEKNFPTGAAATGTTQIPSDDTIPQNTEGDEYMQLSITPRAVTNFLRIETVINVAHSTTGQHFAVALFQDAIVNALASAIQTPGGTSNEPMCISFIHYMLAGTVAATTFKVRAGSNSGGTTTFNGFSGARKHGGVLASSTTIKEIQP